MEAISVGRIVGSAIAGAPLGPAIAIGIGLVAVKGALDLAGPMIFEAWNRNSVSRDETVVPRAPVLPGGGSTSYGKKEEVWSRDESVISRAPGSKITLSDKQVAEIEGAMKHAQIAYEIRISAVETKSHTDKKRDRAHVASGMWNTQPRTLKLYSFGSFSGNFVVMPPESMVESPRYVGLFLHQGPEPDDDSKSSVSKGYVIYGTDEDRPLLLYILGWCKPAKGSPKVYVQAGLLPNMLKQPYNLIKQVGQLPNNLLDQLKDHIRQEINKLEDQIMQKLLNQVDEQTRETFNELKGHQCSSYDPETGAEAAAEIRSAYPGCRWALLGATFSRRER